MQASLTIEEFHAQLASEENDNSLLVALRECTRIENPEKVAQLAVVPMSNWTGWN